MKPIHIEVHPLMTLKHLAETLPIKAFNLISYGRKSDSYGKHFQDRKRFAVAAADVVKRGQEIIVDADQQGLDVVVDSRVQMLDSMTDRHIPLIDFGLPLGDAGIRCALFYGNFQEVTGADPRSFHIYNSGRSYHGYGTSLLTSEEWQQFMASLLVVAPLTDATAVVDARWIGHSLLKDSGALRLSCYCSHYQQMPSRVWLD